MTAADNVNYEIWSGNRHYVFTEPGVSKKPDIDTVIYNKKASRKRPFWDI